MSCAFNGKGQLTLVFGTGSGYATGKNLALVIDKAFQGVDILVIDIDNTRFGEFALFLLEVAFFGVCGIF